jgi:formamidopyrimidine-DNA glycosylase
LPELPEVQTVVNSLQEAVKNKIKSFSFSWERVIYNHSPSNLEKKINNNNINNISRIGKYILIYLDNYILACHLRMTGYLYISSEIPKNKKHVRCYFELSNGKYLIFKDIRKFGGFFLYNNLDILTNKLGLDPFDKLFTRDWLLQNCKNKKRKIKNLLLDQSFICGLGNIYVDEVLWHSKIRPNKISNNIPKLKILNMHYYIQNILEESIKYHGTTIINFKFDNMKTGNYKNNLKVYGRENLPCFSCDNIISKNKTAGRSTHFCKSCQN